ncbi:helix-turn-helix transcriptional regulator [Candidatus Sumerlaeota bacterium]|nr:helix-turn-helix transcriptional regulator [Candidatus Sumerlaeota bacterium]
MQNLAQFIQLHRTEAGLTQDAFGALYGVSGPAIFKFERGYVNPSLDLWLSISKDCGVPRDAAVLLWVQAKLPPEHRGLLDDLISEKFNGRRRRAHTA